MVNMIPIIAVLCVAVAVHASTTDTQLPINVKRLIREPGKQYALYERFTKEITLPENANNEIFTGLDIKRNKKVDDEDIKLWFWHKDLDFAIQKFNEFVKDNPGKNEITVDDLTDDTKDKKEIKVALVECQYIKSNGLKQSCYADQILTYTALCLSETAIDEFFGSIGNGDEKITKEELKTEVDKLNTEGSLKMKVSQNELLTISEELGHYSNDEGIDKKEFTDYVTQESINDDFRECRKQDNTFDNGCLFRELVEYTLEDLTEMDISVVFDALDSDDDKKITKEELKKNLEEGLSQEELEGIIAVLDISGNSDIDYSEFRTYMMSPTVMLQLERSCIRLYTDQIEEIECAYDKVLELLHDKHTPIWLNVPDLENVQAFEIFDTSDDGKILGSELSFADQETKDRFIKEMDVFELGGEDEVCLEEFNEYVNIPHMVYGIADCLLKETTEREGCYKSEIENIIKNFRYYEEYTWVDWFDYYDDTKPFKRLTEGDGIEKKMGTQENEHLFLDELGQGNKVVTLFEFTWYVKQQDLAANYQNKIDTKNLLVFLDETQVKTLSEILKTWIEEALTEFDIVQLFTKLDTDKNGELTSTELPPALVKKIDELGQHGDADETVNYREFWQWIKQKEVKESFENECTKTKTTQGDEITCYHDKIKAMEEKAQEES